MAEGIENEDAVELKKELGRSIERSNELQRAYTSVVEDKKNLEREYEAAKEELNFLKRRLDRESTGGGHARTGSLRKRSSGGEEEGGKGSNSPLTRRNYFNYSSAKESFRKDKPEREYDQVSSPHLGGLGPKLGGGTMYNTFDRRDLFAVSHLGRYDTGTDGGAVEVNGAGATLRNATAEFRARQAQILPYDP